VKTRSFSDGLAAVQAGNGLWGYMDKNGIERISPQFTLAWSFGEGVAAAYHDGKCGFIDLTGAVVFHFGLTNAEE